jgi:hypothetical protein
MLSDMTDECKGDRTPNSERPFGPRARVNTNRRGRSCGKLNAALVWQHLESQPGFNEDLRRAEEELRQGKGVLYEVKGGALRKVRRKR